MPHQCTTCGRTFEDGSKEMLSGCPDCGGNKFQFMPAGAVDGNAGGTTGAASAATAPKKTPETTPSTPTEHSASAAETEGDGRASAVDRAAATVREWVSVRDDGDSDDSPGNDSRDDSPATGPSGSTRNDPPEGRPTETVPETGTEDSAQASARRDVVSKEELPDELPQSHDPIADSTDLPDEENVVDAPQDENPGLKELREELNSQFESIRIVNPGQYELNLMELYEREEYIISLQEDGKYVIEVPDAWEQTER